MLNLLLRAFYSFKRMDLSERTAGRYYSPFKCVHAASTECLPLPQAEFKKSQSTLIY